MQLKWIDYFLATTSPLSISRLNNGNLEHSDETSPAFYIPQNRCKFQQEFVCDSCLGFLFLSFIIPISIIIIIAIIIAIIIIMNENAYLLNPFELLIVVPFNNNKHFNIPNNCILKRKKKKKKKKKKKNPQKKKKKKKKKS